VVSHAEIDPVIVRRSRSAMRGYANWKKIAILIGERVPTQPTTEAANPFSLNPDGPDFRTSCANGILLVDCLHTSILRADFHFCVKTVTDVENPFSHYTRLVKVNVFQFRRFVPSVTAETAELYCSDIHNSSLLTVRRLPP
jgi:hypothetical protein